MRFLRLPEVIKLTGMAGSTIYDHIAQGTFPRQRKIGKKSVIWLEEEILEWMRSHLETAA